MPEIRPCNVLLSELKLYLTKSAFHSKETLKRRINELKTGGSCCLRACRSFAFIRTICLYVQNDPDKYTEAVDFCEQKLNSNRYSISNMLIHLLPNISFDFEEEKLRKHKKLHEL